MYRHVVVAGTFDRLHKGHEAVLTRAFAEGSEVTIGLTSDEYVKYFKIKNQKSIIRSFVQRKAALKTWLEKNDLLDRATIVHLDDPYGPVVPSSHRAALPPDIDAIVVSSETRPRAEEINTLRSEARWKPLAIIEVPMVPAEDRTAISSTRIRNKEINHDGRLIMPDNLRPELQKPLGRVLTGENIKSSIRSHLAGQGETFIKLITVGDVATKTFLDTGVVPDLAIIDGKVERKPYPDALESLTRSDLVSKQGLTFKTVKSGPGYISREAMEAVKDTLAGINASVHQRVSDKTSTHRHIDASTPPVVIFVDGEEDLLALPAIAYAPVRSVIYYGQPRLSRDKPEGLVEVIVNEKKKQIATAFLGQFRQ